MPQPFPSYLSNPNLFRVENFLSEALVRSITYIKSFIYDRKSVGSNPFRLDIKEFSKSDLSAVTF